MYMIYFNFIFNLKILFTTRNSWFSVYIVCLQYLLYIMHVEIRSLQLNAEGLWLMLSVSPEIKGSPPNINAGSPMTWAGYEEK